MQLRMWTYDLAREQAPTLDHLRRFFDVTRAGGYNAIGLYLEHRFTYPSTPWAHGAGSLTPETVAILLSEYPDIQVIPFVNLLGHMEGFLYTEYGSRFAEERFKGLQANPTHPDLVTLAERIIDDTLAIFPSEIIHIGGDETWQLGAGEGSRARVAEYEQTPGFDGKAHLYGDHFGPLAQRIVDAGRRPAVWGDMFFDHPSALELIPRQTIIFDWQYFRGPSHTSRVFRDQGYDVVYCPALHTYNASWLHLPQSEENVREHAVAAVKDDVMGVCVTTWELALMGNYETILPAIRASGLMLKRAESDGATALPNPNVGDPKTMLEIDGFTPSESPAQSDLLAEALLYEFLTAQAGQADLISRDGELEIQFTYPNRTEVAGRVPAEQAELLQKTLASFAQEGVISGRINGAPFSVQFEVKEDGAITELRTTPLPNGALYASCRKAPNFLRAYLEDGETHEEFARLLGIELLDCHGPFAFTGIRSAMKCRMLLYSNPFLFWLRNRDEILGEPGDRALEVLERAISVSPDSSYRASAEFVRLSIEFVRQTEDARRLYAAGLPGESTNALIVCRQIFENLLRIARATNLRIGGSMADIERCHAGKEHVEKVIRRVKLYGDGVLGYLPSFETLTHPKFIPHDQGNWWLINRWANE